MNLDKCPSIGLLILVPGNEICQELASLVVTSLLLEHITDKLAITDSNFALVLPPGRLDQT